jgi:hypothetical protein
MKNKISASKAKKKQEITTAIVPITQDKGDSYLDRSIIHALHENHISVSYQGNSIYLIQHKGPSHKYVSQLPREEDFHEILKTEFKVDIAPFIVKHRESDCFTCKMLNQKCLDPKTCGNIIKKNKPKQLTL